MIFGLTEEQLTHYGVQYGVAGLILYMMLIIWKLAKDSQAGRFGTAILFLVLSLGMIGFMAKEVIVWALHI